MTPQPRPSPFRTPRSPVHGVPCHHQQGFWIEHLEVAAAVISTRTSSGLESPGKREAVCERSIADNLSTTIQNGSTVAITHEHKQKIVPDFTFNV
ncbi:hypothetical protein EJB05_36420 [Eragrostis curvula]|uniref:Uncharacterized protein n=1 Tax=Eragrostis curvula TaxID=38414 RepID=A0A5J9UAI3_9POAL|nr:hypothetical protein EJB05_36420 [Eragrostis curvula]